MPNTHKIIYFLLICLLTKTSQAQLSTQKGFFLKGLHSDVRIFDRLEPYVHYDVLPITGFAFGAAQETIFFDFLRLNSKLGFAQSGFEGRQYIQTLEDTPQQYREELWSTYRLNAITLETGLKLYHNKLVIGTNFRLSTLLWASEKSQKVFLTDIDAVADAFLFDRPLNIFEPIQKIRGVDFNTIGYGLHYYIGAELFSDCFFEIGLYQGLGRIRDIQVYNYLYQQFIFDLGITYFFNN